MINYTQQILDNGIKIIINQDYDSSHVALCYTFDAGSKYDLPEKSGMAHLLEHVLYTGTDRFPNYDDYLQVAGGDGNAYTNQDIACFYTLIPIQNLMPYLEMEADRFTKLRFDHAAINVQKNVVIEEYKETCINEPYGDLWHHLGALIYGGSPYEWPPIGTDINSINRIQPEDLRDFFNNLYVGNRITIAISGPVNPDELIPKLEQLFSSIKSNHKKSIFPFQNITPKNRTKEIETNVPVDQLFLCYPGTDRLDPNYIIDDFIIELVFAEGSLFLEKLIKEKRLINELEIYQSGHFHKGLVVVEARPAEHISMQQLVKEFDQDLKQFIQNELNEQSIIAALNRIESQLTFSSLNVLNKAMNLSYYGWLNKLEWMINELSLYRDISKDQIVNRGVNLFDLKNSFELRYRATNHQ